MAVGLFCKASNESDPVLQTIMPLDLSKGTCTAIALRSTPATKVPLRIRAFHRVASKKLWPNAIAGFQAAAATGRMPFNRSRMRLHCANDAV